MPRADFNGKLQWHNHYVRYLSASKGCLGQVSCLQHTGSRGQVSVALMNLITAVIVDRAIRFTNDERSLRAKAEPTPATRRSARVQVQAAERCGKYHLGGSRCKNFSQQ